MSRYSKMAHTFKTGFPRVSGDEPRDLLNVMRAERFSPRERG